MLIKARTVVAGCGGNMLTVTGPQDLTLNYAANGNITVRSDLGTTNQFIYGNNVRPYQLASIKVDSALQIVPETLQQLA
jgi:hypothetical protein